MFEMYYLLINLTFYPVGQISDNDCTLLVEFCVGQVVAKVWLDLGGVWGGGPGRGPRLTGVGAARARPGARRGRGSRPGPRPTRPGTRITRARFSPLFLGSTREEGRGGARVSIHWFIITFQLVTVTVLVCPADPLLPGVVAPVGAHSSPNTISPETNNCF